MKNSKTTIKELTKMYRKVLLKCLVIAMVLSFNVSAQVVDVISNGTAPADGTVIGTITFEQAQWDALASGIDSTKVAQIETNKNGIATNTTNISANTTAIDTINNSDVMNSGIDSTKVAQIETNKNDIAQNTADIATNTADIAQNTADISANATAIDVINNSDVMNSGIDSTKVAQIETNKNNIAQNTADIATNATAIDAINNSDVMNSGIDATKVAQIETNKNDIAQNTADIVANATDIADNRMAIGDRNYSSTNYISVGDDLTTAVSDLDFELGRIEYNLGNIEHDLNQTRREMKGGFAAAAAMSALVPNARADGDTQIAIGTGTYQGRGGMAIGGFHYLNDNTLINVGGAYAGSKSATFKAGVTFGW